MHTVSQQPEALDLAVVKQLGYSGKGAYRRYIAQDDVAHAAPGETRVKCAALRADASVFGFIPGAEGWKHDTVFKRHAADGDRFEYFHKPLYSLTDRVVLMSRQMRPADTMRHSEF